MLAGESNEELERRYGCVDVHELQHEGAAYKALVFKLPKAGETDSDYRVVFYKNADGMYRRHGAELNLVNYERPTLTTGAEPRIEATERRLGVRFHLRLTAAGGDLVPAEETNPDGSLKGRLAPSASPSAAP